MPCMKPGSLRSPWRRLPPAVASGGKISRWEIGPLRAALKSGVLPVIFGDIVFDPVWAAKVLSTEVLMWHLAQELKPNRILLAGLEEAVWADFPSPLNPDTSDFAGDLRGRGGQNRGISWPGRYRRHEIQGGGDAGPGPGRAGPYGADLLWRDAR